MESTLINVPSQSLVLGLKINKSSPKVFKQNLVVKGTPQDPRAGVVTTAESYIDYFP